MNTRMAIQAEKDPRGRNLEGVVSSETTALREIYSVLKRKRKWNPLDDTEESICVLS